MNSFKKLACLSAATTALVLATSPAVAAVYAVSQSGSGVSATGSITTDGTLGTLAQANITDWVFNLNDGSSTFTLNGASNSQLLYSGGLSATATGLFFDFSGTGIALFQNPATGSGINFICFTGSPLCGGGTNRTSISVSNFGGGIAQQGVQQIGRLENGGAVPEPATWAMMISGFGIAGFAMRRFRDRKVSVTFA